MRFKKGDRVRWYTGLYTGTVSRVTLEHLYVYWDHSDPREVCKNVKECHILIDPMDEIDPYEVDA